MGLLICFSGYFFHNFCCTKQLTIFQGLTEVIQINIYARLANKWKTWSFSTWLFFPYIMLMHTTVVTAIFCIRTDKLQSFHIYFTLITAFALEISLYSFFCDSSCNIFSSLMNREDRPQCTNLHCCHCIRNDVVRSMHNV